MSATPKLDHEEFTVEKDRFKVVREGRREPDMPCTLEMKGVKYHVIDYSTFGLSIAIDQSLDFEFADRATFSLGAVDVTELSVRVTYKQKRDGDRLKCGIEIVEGEIDMDMLDSYRTALDVIELARSSFIGDASIPVEFQLKTLALKSKFYAVSKVVNDAGRTILAHSSATKNRHMEQTFAEFFSPFLRDTFTALVDDLQSSIKPLSRPLQLKAQEFFRKEVGEFIFSAPFVDRIHKKPYGYAGDFEMMNHIYNNDLLGETLFARCFNKAILEAPASRAVRNRSEFLFRKIKDFVEQRKGEQVRILSVASGPAREIQLLLERCPDLAKQVQIDLLDQDLQSLKMAKVSLGRLFRKTGAEVRVSYVNLAIKNILETGLEGGPYDMIYSAGLFDYFSDAVARIAASALYRNLADKGRMIIGNFSIENPTRFIMECGGDWHLIHRSADDMKKVLRKLPGTLSIEMEDENINLFALLDK